jgi:hypothetical protein
LSSRITIAVKNDGMVGSVRVIPHAVLRLEEQFPVAPFLKTYFGSGVKVVPMPRSTPTSRGSLWPALRICEELLRRGLVGAILPCLERREPVQKASISRAGAGPEPADHRRTLVVNRPLLSPGPGDSGITVVDDVITRGSSFVGVHEMLTDAFVGIPIRYLVLVRAIGDAEVDDIVLPIEGTIRYRRGRLHRQP